ncbi:hypothetical protein [Variovorax saccharolyticus]|uniref:hypothetical protein n=1 Tax=Variovorax saccharolyticus TaxID=3053516 RepID=UPI00257598CF|nr:hypothetical protein [Variovorax sp. J31P216]MDM0029174.1 hypothetical protein [Variovorax sp. J31P216]
MKSEQIPALNYSAHAIEDLRRIEARLRGAWPMSSQAIRRLTRMLDESVKFVLPNCCDLIAPEDLRQAHLDLLHLPYPLVAFEAPWEHPDGHRDVEGFPQTPATKRIALCWEARPEYEVMPGLHDILATFPQGGAFVVPIYWAPAAGEWMVAIGGQFVPYANTLNESDGAALPASRLAQAAMKASGRLSRKERTFRAEPFWLLREPFELAVQSYAGAEKAYAQIILDASDEVQMLVQACSVLNCANVTTCDIQAPAALNKKRRAKGKQPFFSYKVLQLAEDRRGTVSGDAGGTHGSPRMHLRRGHIRRKRPGMAS